jgi:hypothetical protein
MAVDMELMPPWARKDDQDPRSSFETASQQPETSLPRHDFNRAAEDVRWPAPVEFDGSITPVPAGGFGGREGEIQLAEIVPSGRPDRALPEEWLPPPRSTRVLANRGTDLSVPDTSDLRPLPAVDGTAEGQPVGQNDLPSSLTPSVFTPGGPTESPGGPGPAKQEKALMDSAPPPPAEDQSETESLTLEPVNWVDEPEAGIRDDHASIPLPVLFGISVGAAFLIGLALRRRAHIRADHRC